MAILDETNRQKVWAIYMREISSAREVINLRKSDLRAAVDAIDQWVEDNQASYNTALPPAARTNLTAKQKSNLLMYVVRRRFEVI